MKMEKREECLSLDSLAKRRGQELRSLGTGDGTTRALFSSGSTNTYAKLKSRAFGLRPKFPAFKVWEDSDE